MSVVAVTVLGCVTERKECARLLEIVHRDDDAIAARRAPLPRDEMVKLRELAEVETKLAGDIAGSNVRLLHISDAASEYGALAKEIASGAEKQMRALEQSERSRDETANGPDYNAPFMEATPAMLQAVAEITVADRAGPFTPHDEVMRRLREHHGRK